MSSKAQDSNKIFLKDIINIIDQLDIDFNNALRNYTQIKNTFKSKIEKLIEIIDSNKDPLDDNYDNYLKDKKACFDNIKQKYKKYNEAIFEIYDNDYIKKIKKYNEKLNDLINKIIPDFEPPNANSFSCEVNFNLPNINN